jgi:hypothetical protein
MTPSQLINNVMANFSWTLTVNGVTSTCLSVPGIVNAAQTTTQTWNCVVSAPAPPSGPPSGSGPGPKLVQSATSDDTGVSTWTLPLKQPSVAGNTLVVLALGNPNGIAAPLPTAAGVTFVECAACAAVTGDRYQGHVYYAIGAASVSSIRFNAVGSAYNFAAYELSGVTGLDSGASLSSQYNTTCSAAAPIKTLHPNALLVAGLLNMDAGSLTGEAAPWVTEGPAMTDYNTTFAHTTQAAAGAASISDKFPACGYGRPTISVAAFY